MRPLHRRDDRGRIGLLDRPNHRGPPVRRAFFVRGAVRTQTGGARSGILSRTTAASPCREAFSRAEPAAAPAARASAEGAAQSLPSNRSAFGPAPPVPRRCGLARRPRCRAPRLGQREGILGNGLAPLGARARQGVFPFHAATVPGPGPSRESGERDSGRARGPRTGNDPSPKGGTRQILSSRRGEREVERAFGCSALALQAEI